jgi:hypothetical protein
VRNRRGLNRIGMLAIALIIALGATGVAYSAWIDEIFVTGTLSTSDDINTSLECSTCSPASGPTYITCAPSDPVTVAPLVLTITVVNAQPSATYDCYFIVSNAVNSWPVKVQSVTLSADPYAWSTGTLAVSPKDTVLNTGQSAAGKVTISIASSGVPAEQNLIYTLTVVVN